METRPSPTDTFQFCMECNIWLVFLWSKDVGKQSMTVLSISTKNKFSLLSIGLFKSFWPPKTTVRRSWKKWISMIMSSRLPLSKTRKSQQKIPFSSKNSLKTVSMKSNLMKWMKTNSFNKKIYIWKSTIKQNHAKKYP